jgi:RNA polymerase sigma factor (sigma-70 family)
MSARAGSAVFAATDWSLIVAAANSGSPEAQSALESLCRTYWFPLYAYLRRKGHAAADAEDLLQQFFLTRVITKRVLVDVHPGAGRFRSWLLTCLHNMVVNELQRPKLPRPAAPVAVLDAAGAEERYVRELADTTTAEAAYDRSWVLGLVERAREALRQEYRAAGRAAWFDELEGYLPGPRSARPYEAIAQRLQVTENHVRSEANKLRRKCGERLYAEIRRTVHSPAEAKQELEYLLGLLE